MNILAVDDEPLMLWQLTEELSKVFTKQAVHGFDEADDALEYVISSKKVNEPVEFAFLDIKLRGVLGIDLAKQIKDVSPETKVVFCTAYSDYAMEAFGVFAIGYLLKPITADMIQDVLKHLDFKWENEPEESSEVRVQTFGNFEVFVNGKQLFFEREKAKELFAYLVDRRGASVTNVEISLVLWEDDSKVRNVGTILSSLRKTLKEAGVEDVLVKARNHTAIDTSKVKCDLYDFYKGDAIAVNSYQGEYMINYSWAELTNGSLLNI